MFLELDVEVSFSFDSSSTTGFEFNSLRASLLTVLRVVYSYFEKGCREKAKKCTRQSREVIWDMINEF